MRWYHTAALWAFIVASSLVFVFLVVLLLATSGSAHAQTRPGWRQYCNNWGHCEWRRVRVYTNHAYRLPEREEVREYREEEGWERRDPRLERGVSCKENVGIVRVVGGKHLTEAGAIKDAVGRWESSVGYDNGEKFANMQNARGYRWRCDKASTNETSLGKASEFVAGAITGGNADAFYKRCVVAAMPCMQPLQRGDEDKR